MHGAYVGAIEARLGWLRWSYGEQAQQVFSLDRVRAASSPQSPLSMGRYVLTHGDTFYMDRKFCHLVDYARESLPDETVYEPQWLLRPEGWLWMGEPVRVPDLLVEDQKLTPEFTAVRAVGWRRVPKGAIIGMGNRGHEHEETYAAQEDLTHFLFFISFADYRNVLHGAAPVDNGAAAAEYGFGVWSYFTLRPGDTVLARITRFEREMRARDPSGVYVDEPGRRMNRLHEIRWMFTALRLMSQRLSTTIRVPTDRHVRRRAVRTQQEAPPYIDVVTLRRLHHHAIRSGQDKTTEVIDWQWQWTVRGHWRQQWYPGEGVHKPKWIESYLKGPEDKPLKPTSAVTLFAARR